MADLDLRARRSRHSLAALHLGDAFGEQFFWPTGQDIGDRVLPPSPRWPYTDDTAEAAVLTRHLLARGAVDQDELAQEWTEEYTRDPRRGYGGGAHDLFEAFASGAPWRDTARAAFGGTGSMGNGSAMRVAPLGAFFADDLDLAAEQAALSAEVTHPHPDGIAGAVATAVAAALIGSGAADLWGPVLDLTPNSMTRVMLEHAIELSDASLSQAIRELGTGHRVCTFDTVPFCLWIVARHRHDSLEDALWSTVSGLGDRDTTCAIVAGILGASLDAALPQAWLARLEPLEV